YIEKISRVIIERIRTYAKSQNYKIQAIGLGAHIKPRGKINGKNINTLLFEAPSLASKLWLELDILPFIFGTRGKNVDERAIEVDLNGIVKLVDLEHYENTVCPETWKILLKIVDQLKTKKAGNFRHYEEEISQHFAGPSDARLTQDDKDAFINWSDNNVERFWCDEEGPIKTSDVIIIDDPQDPLDGLNKDLNQSDLNYYKSVYNRLSIDQCGVEIDFNRPYVVQIARFDPSKGIPLVIESFKIFRDKLKREGWSPEKMPSLIICGASSIDDPDGSPIYDQTCLTLQRSEYADIADDVSVVRLPACDQIFNTMLRCAHVVLQLSGIPLQIKHEETGFLVNIGDTAQVADYLVTLFTNDKLYQKMSSLAKSTVNEQYFTVSQTLNWLYLIDRFASIRKK
ncbi:13685_t:CDS:2, partial [Racocetra fulgida]